jgi:DedD protein
VKERLTGAIILVALIVLLVPELLSGPIRSAPRAAVVGSSAEEPPLRSYTINLADDAHARTVPTRPSEPQPAPTPGRSLADETTAAPDRPAAHSAPANESSATLPTPAATTAVASPSPPAPSANGSGAFVVQLGSFASRANADRLAHQVRSQGFPASVSQGSTGRRLYRVRVGPAHDHAAANQLAEQLRARGHTGGSIVPQ